MCAIVTSQPNVTASIVVVYNLLCTQKAVRGEIYYHYYSCYIMRLCCRVKLISVQVLIQ